jgi:hypothetical protein
MVMLVACCYRAALRVATKNSLPSIFLACKRQRWRFFGSLKYDFFFSFFNGKKFLKHCCKGFWINCDCPPSHEVMDIQKVGIIAKFLFLSYL